MSSVVYFPSNQSILDHAKKTMKHTLIGVTVSDQVRSYLNANAQHIKRYFTSKEILFHVLTKFIFPFDPCSHYIVKKYCKTCTKPQQQSFMEQPPQQQQFSTMQTMPVSSMHMQPQRTQPFGYASPMHMRPLSMTIPSLQRSKGAQMNESQQIIHLQQQVQQLQQATLNQPLSDEAFLSALNEVGITNAVDYKPDSAFFARWLVVEAADVMSRAQLEIIAVLVKKVFNMHGRIPEDIGSKCARIMYEANGSLTTITDGYNIPMTSQIGRLSAYGRNTQPQMRTVHGSRGRGFDRGRGRGRGRGFDRGRGRGFDRGRGRGRPQQEGTD